LRASGRSRWFSACAGSRREAFSIAAMARDFLRHNLPRRLLRQLDLGRIALSKDTYVTKEIKTAYSDLVYRVGVP